MYQVYSVSSLLESPKRTMLTDCCPGYSIRQVSGTVNRRGTTLITFDMEFACVIFNLNSVV